MFQFPALSYDPYFIQGRIQWQHHWAFPHSEISGSMPGWRLPGAYRSRPTSFIDYRRQNILHTPFVA